MTVSSIDKSGIDEVSIRVRYSDGQEMTFDLADIESFAVRSVNQPIGQKEGWIYRRPTGRREFVIIGRKQLKDEKDDVFSWQESLDNVFCMVCDDNSKPGKVLQGKHHGPVVLCNDCRELIGK